MGWRRPAHTVAYSRKGQFLRQSSYGLSGGVGGDFRPVGRREALGGGFCAIQRLGGAPAGRQRQIGVKELAGEQSKRYHVTRSEEHTSELQSLMRISYAVFCLKKKKKKKH